MSREQELHEMRSIQNRTSISGLAASTGQSSLTPTVIRGSPKPLTVPQSKRQAEQNRPEMLMLKEIVPTLESNVLLEILRGNEWDLDRSTDAALALYASLSAEEGTAILGQVRQTTRADVDDATSETQQNHQKQRSLYSAQRGMPVILPESFLTAPRYRLVVDYDDALKTDFTVTFRRRNEKLGITIQEIDSEICIHTLHSRSNGSPLLALEADIKVGDVLTGMNTEYFSPGAEVQDVIDMLHLAGHFVTLHFTRRHRPDEGAGRVHKCAQMLVEQEVIPPEKAMFVTNLLNRLKERVLTWDSGWISQRIQRWKLDVGLQVPKATTNFTAHALDRLAAGGSAANRRSVDIGVSTKDLRPALSVRLLRAEERRDHVVYVVWVMDVRSGIEWVVRRRFREFYDFRDLLVSIRPGIGSVDFPPKRLSVTETALVTAERIYLLQRFLRRVSSLVCVNTLHPSTARVQLALQNFLELGERERLNVIHELEARDDAGLKNMIQVYVHSVMQMAVMDKVLSGFLDNFEEEAESDHRRAWNEAEGRKVLFAFRDFVDNLQNVLHDGLGEECVLVADSYRVSFRESFLKSGHHDNRTAQQPTPTPTPTTPNESSDALDMESPPRASFAQRQHPQSPLPTSPGSSYQDTALDEDSLDDLGRGCLHISLDGEESFGPAGGSNDEGAEMGCRATGMSAEGASDHGLHSSEDHAPSASSSADCPSQTDIEQTMLKLSEDEMRSLVRSCIRRQVEIELYVSCSTRLKFVLESSFAVQEKQLQRKISQLSHQPQSYYGVSIGSISPSSWDEVVYLLRNIRSKTLPHDRLNALLAAAKGVPALFMREHPGAAAVLGADEFLPIFIYVLVRAQLPHLLALNEELQALCDPDKRLSETGYYLATFEASISHIMEADTAGGALFSSAPGLTSSASDDHGDGDQDGEEGDFLESVRAKMGGLGIGLG